MKPITSPLDDDTLLRRIFDFAVNNCDVDAPDALLSAVLTLLNSSQDEDRADRAAFVLFVHFREELREALNGRV